MSGTVRWNPFRELKEIQNRLNRTFSSVSALTSDEESFAFADWAPAVGVVPESDKEYALKVDRSRFSTEAIMRVLGVSFALLFWVGTAAAQPPGAKPAAPAPTAKPAAQASPAQPAVRAAGSPPVGTLLQVMRGILFHSSNLIFATQGEDPADPKKPLDASFGTYAKVYTGWPVVENAAVTLAESADLLLKPGRLCSNGRPVPLDRADYRKFVQGLRAAGQAALKAAQSKNMDNMIEVSGTVAEACENCHSVYRDKPDLKNRCIP
jgi:hypothetical protein